MKRIGLIIISVFLIFVGANAQNVDDALRYSQIYYGGTARFMSMGGAFTSLGGDISTLGQNPAGIGVFRSSEMTFTPQIYQINTTAGFNGSSKFYLSNFNLNQIGMVLNIVSGKKESGLMNLNIGYSFNRTNNLIQTVTIRGISNTSSMADYWAALGNKDGGTYYSDLGGAEQNAFDAWVMDTVTGSGGRSYATAFSNYGDNPPSKYGQTISRQITNLGSLGEHDITIGGNYSDKLFFGGTFAITRLDFISHYEHLESVNTPLLSQLKDFTYTDHFEDYGTGYSFKLGVIYKPVEAVRIGMAFHSPTWYHINDYWYNDITSHFTDGTHYEFSTTPSRFSYDLTTPYRLLAGVGLQIQKIALLSADYEFVDYSNARFSPSGDNFDYSNTNAEVKSSLKSASNLRFGAEVRLDKFYLRGGYGYYGKAFRSGEDNANLDYNSFSGGAGFRVHNISFDFAYTHFNYSQKYFLYPVDLNVTPAEANLTTNKNIFTFTFGYKFGI